MAWVRGWFDSENQTRPQGPTFANADPVKQVDCKPCGEFSEGLNVS